MYEVKTARGSGPYPVRPPTTELVFVEECSEPDFVGVVRSAATRLVRVERCFLPAGRVNRPRSALANRASSPLRVSRRIEAYRVASGVLPPGLDQSPSAVMASTIALQFMGSPASARTWIAAWN